MRPVIFLILRFIYADYIIYLVNYIVCRKRYWYMKKLARNTACFALACCLMLGCAGCSRSDDSADGYLDLLDSPSTTLNNVWYNTGGIFRCAVFDSLVTTNADMKTIRPALAETYEASDDGLTYTFVLRENAKWHDGESVTAEDVLFSLKTLLRSEEVNGLLASAFGYIEGAERFQSGSTEEISGCILEGSTLTFRLTSRVGSFLNAMAQFAILPEHILGGIRPEDLEADEYWTLPIGCGPYRITESVPGSHFILERNPDWYGAKPGIEKICLRVGMEDPVSAVESGELDFYVTNDPEEIAQLKGVDTCTDHRLNVLFPAYLIFNLSEDEGVNEDLKDARVRKALLMAIDREVIVNAIFPGSTVSDTLVPAWDSWYLKDGEAYAFDPDGAKALLHEAGYDFSQTLRLRYFTKGQATADLMSAIAVYWRAIGLQVDLEMFDGSGSKHMFQTRDYDVCYKRLSAFNHAAIYEEMAGSGVMQMSIYNMPVYDALIGRLDVTLDDGTRETLVEQLQRLDQEHLLRLPLFTLENVAFVNEARFAMPEAYGNLWYRYDLCFEDWRLLGE